MPVPMCHIVTPRFLTQEIAKQAVEHILISLFNSRTISPLLKRMMCHVVVLVPSMQDHREEGYPNWPNYPLEPHCIYEHSVLRTEWEHHFDTIARSKAIQKWYDRNDDRTDIIPHLLFPGDTPYWGAVKRHGIVVSCSGVQPWFDKMISGMITDMIIALAYNAWMTSKDKEEGVDFLF